MYVNHVPLRTVYHLCPSANCWQLLPIIASYLVDEQNVGLTDKCPTCQQHQLEHVCQVSGQTALLPVTRQAPPPWLPILKATVTAACPTCGAAINLADTVANDPAATASERAAAATFRNGALAVGAALVAVRAAVWIDDVASN